MTAVSEESFLQRWLPRLQNGRDLVIPPGDDCAAIRQADGSLLLAAADQVVAGRHYLRDEAGERVGRKLLARNLSDIAAMGGVPTHALLTLALPPDTSAARADAIMAGVCDLAAESGVAVIGGDVCAADAESATLTILGSVAPDRVIRRSTAHAGDLLFVTGCCGASFPTGKHLDFNPRLAEGQFLAQNGFAAAMIDLSDGLALDLHRLCAASNLAAKLDLSAIPRTMIDNAPVAIEAALYDGEDYELLFAVSPSRVCELRKIWPFATPLAQIGALFAKTQASIQTLDGVPIPLDQHAFNHFG